MRRAGARGPGDPINRGGSGRSGSARRGGAGLGTAGWAQRAGHGGGLGAMEIWSSPAAYDELNGNAERGGGADPIARELEEGEGRRGWSRPGDGDEDEDGGEDEDGDGNGDAAAAGLGSPRGWPGAAGVGVSLGPGLVRRGQGRGFPSGGAVRSPPVPPLNPGLPRRTLSRGCRRPAPWGPAGSPRPQGELSPLREWRGQGPCQVCQVCPWGREPLLPWERGPSPPGSGPGWMFTSSPALQPPSARASRSLQP